MGCAEQVSLVVKALSDFKTHAQLVMEADSSKELLKLLNDCRAVGQQLHSRQARELDDLQQRHATEREKHCGGYDRIHTKVLAALQDQEHLFEEVGNIHLVASQRSLG